MNTQLVRKIGIAAVLLIVIVGGYYIMKLRSGGKKAVSFVSLSYKWGVGDSLQNSYNSKTGDYQFLDQRDRLIKENFKLRTNNVIYLHSKLNEQDLLLLPDTIANLGVNLKDSTVSRYEFKFIYTDTIKNIVYFSNYDKDPVIRKKAIALKELVQQVIKEAEERFVNK